MTDDEQALLALAINLARHVLYEQASASLARGEMLDQMHFKAAALVEYSQSELLHNKAAEMITLVHTIECYTAPG